MNLHTLSLDELHSERDLAVYDLRGYSEGDVRCPGYARVLAWLERIDAELLRRGCR